MNILKVFTSCSLCPGNCRLSCPVFNATRDRATAPDVIGRAGYSIASFNRMELKGILLNCTGCGYCRDACPIGNDLPEAIRLARRRLLRLHTIKPRLVYEVGGGDLTVNIYLNSHIDELAIPGRVVKGVRIRVYDTSLSYKAYSYGYDVQLPDGDIHYSLDIDTVKPDYVKIFDSISFISDYNLTGKRLMRYILHIPCKLRPYRDKIIENASRLFGEPLDIITGCSGSGLYLYENRPEYSIRILEYLIGNAGGRIMTLCINTYRLLRRVGIDSITPLHLVKG